MLCTVMHFFKCTDKPDPPGKPEVTDSDVDHISVKWSPPSKDGGAPITGYNVERLDPRTGRWTKANSEPLKVGKMTSHLLLGGMDLEIKIGLIYQFS